VNWVEVKGYEKSPVLVLLPKYVTLAPAVQDEAVGTRPACRGKRCHKNKRRQDRKMPKRIRLSIRCGLYLSPLPFRDLKTPWMRAAHLVRGRVAPAEADRNPRPGITRE